jgi:protein SCO1
LNVPGWVSVLPHVNAALNAAALVLLLLGLWLIRNRKPRAHRLAMLSAFAASIAFLACYLVYHRALVVYTGRGSHGFPGTGLIHHAYLTILLSHTLLAACVPFLAISMIYLASRRRWRGHRGLAKVAFPVWVYVSATGVIIYWMLYHMPLGQRG